MSRIVIYYFSVLLLSMGFYSDASDKSHHEEPSWYYPEDEKWPQTCRHGSRQSPIAISHDNVVKVVQSHTEIKLINYENKITATCLNDGHTVKIIIDPHHELYVVGGGLRGKYALSQIHFHWTSEHTINGRRIPLEGHFVHVDSDTHKYRLKRDAGLSENSDVQVLAVMYRISVDNNTELSHVIDSIQHITTVGSTKNIEFVPRDLLPSNMAYYYRYEGSLTTPPCYEIVQWTVLGAMVPLSLEQYETIRDVESFGGSHKKNFRKLMPINDRVVKLYNLAVINKINTYLYLGIIFVINFAL